MAHYRPRPEPEAYLRLKTLPGEQAQVGWALRQAHDRARRAHPDGLRDGAQLLAGGLLAPVPRCVDGQFPARACRRLRALGRTAAGAALRQSQERGARAPGRGDPVPSDAAGLGGALSLRAPCSVFFAEAEWKALVCHQQRSATPPETPPTLAEAIRLVARLNGFSGAKVIGIPAPPCSGAVSIASPTSLKPSASLIPRCRAAHSGCRRCEQ
jgi:hypothetical protein